MRSYVKSEFIKLTHQKLFIIAFVLYIIFLMSLLFQITKNTFAGQYKFFTTITILFICFYQILSIGEWQEKKIIRYYLEYIPNRNRLLYFEYGKYIGFYIVMNLLFLLPSYSLLGIIHQQVVLYFIIFCLYLTINMNLLIYFERIGIIIILSLLLLWILPNLINLLIVKSSVYRLQLFYYLSPDSFSTYTPITLALAMIYLVLFFLLSMFQFARKEY